MATCHACPEEEQNPVQKQQGDASVENRIYHTEHRYVSQHFLGTVRILLPQADRRNGSATHPDQCTECHQQIHQRKRNSQARYGHGADTMADKYTINNIVQ